ncbi:HNH endonuclease signature motif containing protein [Streptomyces antibioticus]|uniref:HNH endonuclease signature motif containing protein n=1 Tax=Streptomyces antibioticus TaxID=1890 RepID=UPI0036AF50E4
MLRRALDDLAVPRVCAECGVGDIWQGRRLVLEIDHIDGDRLNNRRENLRYLCPSCHGQTSTFSRRGRKDVTASPPGRAQYSKRPGPVPQLAKRAPV